MMPDWLQRFVPAGTSRGKFLAVGGLLVTAIGVVAYDVAWLAEDETLVHAGTEAEPEALRAATSPYAAGLGSAPGAAPDAASAATPSGATPAGPDGAPPATTADGTAAVPGPASVAGSASAAPAPAGRSEPDWAALFAQLAARESSFPGGLSVEAVAPDTDLQELLSGFRLRGLIHDDEGGVALVNGRLLREGDALPGTALTVNTIMADRILLRWPERTALVPLLLEPMQARSGAAGAQ